jgi:hypothetical protein
VATLVCRRLLLSLSLRGLIQRQQRQPAQMAPPSSPLPLPLPPLH